MCITTNKCFWKSWNFGLRFIFFWYFNDTFQSQHWSHSEKITGVGHLWNRMTAIIRIYYLKGVYMDTRTGTALSVALIMFLVLLLTEMRYLFQYEMQNNPFCCIFIIQSQVLGNLSISVAFMCLCFSFFIYSICYTQNCLQVLSRNPGHYYWWLAGKRREGQTQRQDVEIH